MTDQRLTPQEEAEIRLRVKYAMQHRWSTDSRLLLAEIDRLRGERQALIANAVEDAWATRCRPCSTCGQLMRVAHAAPDANRLRQWAEKLETYGPNISEWGDRRFVIEQLRAVAGRIEATVAEVGTLRELARIDVQAAPDATVPPRPHEDPTCEHGRALDVHCCNCHGGFLFDSQSCVCVMEQPTSDKTRQSAHAKEGSQGR